MPRSAFNLDTAKHIYVRWGSSANGEAHFLPGRTVFSTDPEWGHRIKQGRWVSPVDLAVRLFRSNPTPSTVASDVGQFDGDYPRYLSPEDGAALALCAPVGYSEGGHGPHWAAAKWLTALANRVPAAAWAAGAAKATAAGADPHLVAVRSALGAVASWAVEEQDARAKHIAESWLWTPWYQSHPSVMAQPFDAWLSETSTADAGTVARVPVEVLANYLHAGVSIQEIPAFEKRRSAGEPVLETLAVLAALRAA